jgi:hypothetical protein
MAALTAVPKLRKAQQPPLSHRGATPDSDRAKQPTLVEPVAIKQDLNPGDRVAASATLVCRLEKSVQSKKLTKMTRW